MDQDVWILPRQLTISAYARDTKESDSLSAEFSQRAEQSLMWRSKPSQSRTWSTRWQTSDSLSWCASQAWGYHGALRAPYQYPTSPRQ